MDQAFNIWVIGVALHTITIAVLLKFNGNNSRRNSRKNIVETIGFKGENWVSRKMVATVISIFKKIPR